MSQDRHGQVRPEHGVNVRAVPDATARREKHVDFTHSTVHQELHQGRHHHDQSRLHVGEEEAVPFLRHGVSGRPPAVQRVKTEAEVHRIVILLTFNKFVVCIHRVVSLRCRNLHVICNFLLVIIN